MNNVARLGIDIAVRNVKQVEKTLSRLNAWIKKLGQSIAENRKKVEESGNTAEETGRKTEKTLTDADKWAQRLSKSLDKVVKKWLSIGGAIQLVSMTARRAFAKIDEITGLHNMADSAGAAANRIESLGRALRKYGGDASSAASTYTSIGDIIGAARSGRGISQDVVTAASRYGIALNGGMLTEDQLITNVARAMQAQRKKGNMYGVRDIASAFGIDEAMMLHLSEKGANWDRNLPASILAEKEKEAQEAKDLQAKLSKMADELLTKTLPAVNKAMELIIKAKNKATWVKRVHDDAVKFNKFKKESKKFEKSVANETTDEKLSKVMAFHKSVGATDTEARRRAVRHLYNQRNSEVKSEYDAISKQIFSESLIERINQARSYADYYNENGLTEWGLNNVRNMLEGIAGTSANLVNKDGKLIIEVIDTVGALRNTGLTATYNNGTTTLSTSTPGL